MNENTKLIYSTLQDIFKNIWEQQKYAEVKNGVILTLNVAIFAILIKACFPLPQIINSNNVFKTIFVILLFLFVIHIFYILQSFFPKDKNKENFKWTSEKINIFFFGDIQKLQNKQYLDILIDKCNIRKEDINENFLLDLSNQVVKLSEITYYKYNSFKYSIYRMYVLAFLLILYFIFLVL